MSSDDSTSFSVLQSKDILSFKAAELQVEAAPHSDKSTQKSSPGPMIIIGAKGLARSPTEPCSSVLKSLK